MELSQTQVVFIPAIVSDIDGVLILGDTPINDGTSMIRLLQSPLKTIDPDRFGTSSEMKLPFVLLTNGGGKKEDAFLSRINGIHNFRDDDKDKIRYEQLILNYSPLRPIIQSDVFRDQPILVGGKGNPGEIVKHLGANCYISISEFVEIYPYLIPLKRIQRNEETLLKVSARLNLSPKSLAKCPPKIAGIFMLYDPVKWDECIQVITDLLSTPNGSIAETADIGFFDEHIPVYCVSNDITYQDQFRLPRIVFGCFNSSLKAVYKALYHRELEIRQFGKPSAATYSFTEAKCQELLAEYNLASPNIQYKISNFYMIGDNPASDIQGATLAGWHSILVRTGVFKGQDNSPDYPASYVCLSIHEAVKHIFEIEHINFTPIEAIKSTEVVNN